MGVNEANHDRALSITRFASERSVGKSAVVAFITVSVYFFSVSPCSLCLSGKYLECPRRYQHRGTENTVTQRSTSIPQGHAILAWIGGAHECLTHRIDHDCLSTTHSHTRD